MSQDGSKPVEKRSKARKRKFYVMDFAYRGGPPAMVLENIDVLVPKTGIRDPFPGRGFPSYPEPPRFVFGETRDRSPRDLEMYHDYWLISDRSKAVFERVDPAAFAYVACDVRLAKGPYEGRATGSVMSSVFWMRWTKRSHAWTLASVTIRDPEISARNITGWWSRVEPG
jgi:hypothetical protein